MVPTILVIKQKVEKMLEKLSIILKSSKSNEMELNKMDYVYTIYKNPRYNIIQKDNRYLMVDLEQNWYSYLCPMLNWFIPIKFTELTYQEFNNINIFHNGGQKSQGMLAGGIGVTISVLLRSLVGYIDINISRIWIVLCFNWICCCDHTSFIYKKEVKSSSI